LEGRKGGGGTFGGRGLREASIDMPKSGTGEKSPEQKMKRPVRIQIKRKEEVSYRNCRPQGSSLGKRKTNKRRH